MKQMESFHLQYCYMICVVTDIEVTMVAKGRIAFTDTLITSGAISASCSLINSFNSSSQAMNKLLSKQVEGRAVKTIHVMVTTWWSTYSMVEQLLIFEDVRGSTTRRG